MKPEYLHRITQTHRLGCELLERHKFKPEPVEAAIMVERHRWFWKPANPRLILIAESHVHTSATDIKVKVNNGILKKLMKSGAPLPPNEYVRLIYCLGYGEPGLLLAAPKNFRNRGTEFWCCIFHRLSGLPTRRPSYGPNALLDNLNYKLDTLRELWRRGIWLLDASLHAIYIGEGTRLPPHVKAELHRQWWDGYGRFILAGIKRPKVWVVGKTTYDALKNYPGWNWQNWIYQPRAQPPADLQSNWDRLLADAGSGAGG